MIKAVFFDLDGTLLPVEEGAFAKYYFSALAQKMVPYGYDPKELLGVIQGGLSAMHANDGSATNEAAFWAVFSAHYGKEKLADRPIFDDFYRKEFLGLQSICQPNPSAKEWIDCCHRYGALPVITTNPVFPLHGQLARLNFLGIQADHVAFVTGYENSHFTKPNPKYFQEVADRFGLTPEEILLIGNNDTEDGACAYGAGIRCYLIGNCKIYTGKTDLTFPELTLDQVLPVLERELQKGR